MKVLLVNGSPRKNGNTDRALEECAAILNQEGIETELIWIGAQPIRGCTACGACCAKLRQQMHFRRRHRESAHSQGF